MQKLGCFIYRNVMKVVHCQNESLGLVKERVSEQADFEAKADMLK